MPGGFFDCFQTGSGLPRAVARGGHGPVAGGGGARYHRFLKFKNVNKPLIIRLGWAAAILTLYGITFWSIWFFFTQYRDQRDNPQTSVQFDNLDQTTPQVLPAIQICALTSNRTLTEPSCSVRRPESGGGEPKSGQAPTTCSIASFFTVKDAQPNLPPGDPRANDVVCYHFNAEQLHEATVASGASALEIGVDVEMPDLSSNMVTPQGEVVTDPFADGLGVSARLFSKTEGLTTEDAMSGSIVLPVNAVSSVTVTLKRDIFEVSQDADVVRYAGSVSTTKIGTHNDTLSLVDSQGRNVRSTVYVRVFFSSLTVQVTREALGYTWFNAFSDSAAVSGFLVGATLWQGPSYSAWLWQDFLGQKAFT